MNHKYWENKCPYCYHHSLVYSVKKREGYCDATGRYEEEHPESHIFCTYCDADFCTYCGKSHTHGGSKWLTPAKYVAKKGTMLQIQQIQLKGIQVNAAEEEYVEVVIGWQKYTINRSILEKLKQNYVWKLKTII